jgi:hypothetical protein
VNFIITSHLPLSHLLLLPSSHSTPFSPTSIFPRSRAVIPLDACVKCLCTAKSYTRHALPPLLLRQHSNKPCTLPHPTPLSLSPLSPLFNPTFSSVQPSQSRDRLFMLDTRTSLSLSPCLTPLLAPPSTNQSQTLYHDPPTRSNIPDAIRVL